MRSGCYSISPADLPSAPSSAQQTGWHLFSCVTCMSGLTWPPFGQPQHLQMGLSVCRSPGAALGPGALPRAVRGSRSLCFQKLSPKLTTFLEQNLELLYFALLNFFSPDQSLRSFTVKVLDSNIPPLLKILTRLI